MLGHFGRCISYFRKVFIATVVGTAALLLWIKRWQEDDDEGLQRQDAMIDAAAREALANYVRPPVRPDDAEPNVVQPATRVLTPLSQAETIVSPALSDASWELPEAAEAAEDTGPAAPPRPADAVQ